MFIPNQVMVALARLLVSISLGPQTALLSLSFRRDLRCRCAFLPKLCVCLQRPAFMYLLPFIAQTFSRYSRSNFRRIGNSHIDTVRALVL